MTYLIKLNVELSTFRSSMPLTPFSEKWLKTLPTVVFCCYQQLLCHYIYLYFCHIYYVSAWSLYYVFLFNSSVIAVTFCQVAYFVACNIDFILMSPVGIDDLRLSIILIKSICHTIVSCSYESMQTLKSKVMITSKNGGLRMEPIMW